MSKKTPNPPNPSAVDTSVSSEQKAAVRSLRAQLIDAFEKWDRDARENPEQYELDMAKYTSKSYGEAAASHLLELLSC